jgi:hypothetical protein
MVDSVEYKEYKITYDRKPYPTSAFDFDFAHEDYDGAPDSHDVRCGNAGSIEEAKEAIDEIIEDEEFDDFQDFTDANRRSWGSL